MPYCSCTKLIVGDMGNKLNKWRMIYSKMTCSQNQSPMHAESWQGEKVNMGTETKYSLMLMMVWVFVIRDDENNKK